MESKLAVGILLFTAVCALAFIFRFTSRTLRRHILGKSRGAELQKVAHADNFAFGFHRVGDELDGARGLGLGRGRAHVEPGVAPVAINHDYRFVVQGKLVEGTEELDELVAVNEARPGCCSAFNVWADAAGEIEFWMLMRGHNE